MGKGRFCAHPPKPGSLAEEAEAAEAAEAADLVEREDAPWGLRWCGLRGRPGARIGFSEHLFSFSEHRVHWRPA